MKITAFAFANSGPCYHRVVMPLNLMPGVDTIVATDVQEAHVAGCDVFVYNRILPDEVAVKILEWQKKYGFKVCLDIDDYWYLDEHHILYDEYIKNNFAMQQVNAMLKADIVTTTNERLAAEIAIFNPNVHVLPNAIPRRGQFDVERTASHLTRLFWQGSQTHEADINLLQRPIELLNGIAGKIKMVMGGYVESDEWDKMADDYTAKGKHQYKVMKGLAITEYYSMYQDADIALVPLLNTPFNRFKSNLKVLEAANMGIPVICSPVNPYLDLPVIYAKGAGEWIREIERLVHSKKRQKEAGRDLAVYCQEHYNFYTINEKRRAIYEASK